MHIFTFAVGVVLPTTAASLLGRLGHSRRGCILISRFRSRRSFARLLRLDVAESVEEGDAEFPSASEIHEKVDGVVGAHENVPYGVEV